MGEVGLEENDFNGVNAIYFVGISDKDENRKVFICECITMYSIVWNTHIPSII